MSSNRDQSQPSLQNKKDEDSEDDTLNPTTQKFNRLSPNPFKRTYEYLTPKNIFKTIDRHYRQKEKQESLDQQIQNLQAKRRKCLTIRRYIQAQKYQKMIENIKENMHRQQLNQLVYKQHREQQQIFGMHQKEVGMLKEAWQNYFKKLRKRQQKIMNHFKIQEQSIIDEERQKLKKRCKSLKINRSKSLQLEKKENYYLKRGDYHSLSRLNKQIKETKKNQKNERDEKIQKLIQVSQQKLIRQRNKRYSVLVSRLQENHAQKQATYRKQKKRLKQKYKNVVYQLRHTQTIQRQLAVNQLLKQY